MNRSRIHIFILITLFCFCTASCTIFDTREPEDPDTGGGIPFIQPDRAEVVLENLSNAVASLNLQNYLRSIDDQDFMYVPTAQAQNTNADLWTDWDQNHENTYFSNLRSAAQPGAAHRLQLSNVDFETISANQQQVSASYSLTVQHNRNTQGIPTVATGSFLLKIEAGADGLWAITGWQDFAGNSSFTWSDLRAAFY